MYPSARSSFYLVCFACLAAVCLAYGPAPVPAPYAAPVPAPASYAVPLPVDIVKRDETAEAQAQALTNSASAAASAAKISAANWDALTRYGWEMGKPLLVKPYGPLDDLYAAALPPRSFVGQIDPSFRRGSYNNIQHLTGSEIGVVAI